jgi:hypothetical protein
MPNAFANRSDDTRNNFKLPTARSLIRETSKSTKL